MNENNNSSGPGTELRMVVILAGGGGQRMGGKDKGELLLAGHRLVDRVMDRLTPQANRLLLSACHDYGTKLTFIPDEAGGPRGPAAGLSATVNFIKDNFPAQKYFISAPVDGPFLPLDLVERLMAVAGSSYAKDADGDHPTFACWEVAVLSDVLAQYPRGKGVALREILEACHASPVEFPPGPHFLNINTIADLTKAESVLRQMG